METMKMAIHTTPQHRLNQYHNNNNNNNSLLSQTTLYGQTSNSHLAELLSDDSNNNNNSLNINNPNINSMSKPGMTSLLQSPTAMSECAACRKPIKERFLLKALDQLWHEDCLKCACCDCRLGEVGSTLFTKANLILCKRDYLRLFGNTGMCSACSKTIPAFEMVMRAPGGRVYHLECFQCAHCNHRFCIGDRFHLHDNRILCEYDYEELACSNMMSSSNTPGGEGGECSNNNKGGTGLGDGLDEEGRSQMAEKLNESSNSGVQIRPAGIRPHEDGSSGYGSPDSVMSDSAK